MENTQTIEVRPYSIKELSILYGVSSKVLRKWMLPIKEKIGKRNGFYYSVSQVELIFSFIKVPYKKVISE